MPLVSFQALPDSARVWVFGTSAPLDASAEQALLGVVDQYLAQWAAHGAPLTSGRDWREHRFLTIAVDVTQEAASGCSIDGLFRALQRLEREIGTAIVGSGRVYYRKPGGEVTSVDRAEFNDVAERGGIGRDTIVFDTTVDSLGAWRDRFETTAGKSWHGALIPASI